MAKTEILEIKCYTSSFLNTVAKDVPGMAIPFLIIDTRLQELAILIEESGTDEMKLLGYLPD